MPERLDRQMAEVLTRVEALRRSRPLPATPTVEEVRAVKLAMWLPFNADPPRLHDVRDTTVQGPFRDVPVRVYRPTAEAEGGPAILYIHGGGWFSGSLDTHDWPMRQLALDSGMTVIGIDPVRSPEFKFPKPVQDVAAAFGRIASEAGRFGIDPTRLAFAGCSSGANLALGAALMLRQGFFSAGALFYGIYGTGKDTPSALDFGDGRFGLSRDEIAWCVNTYLERRTDKYDPRVAPIRGDLGRLPPMYLAAAELDPLRDDTLDLADRLVACDVPCEARVYKGLAHSYLVYGSQIDGARASIRHAAAHVRRQFFEPMPKLKAEFVEEARHVG